MHSSLFRMSLACSLGFILWSCQPPVAPAPNQPIDCGYDVAKIRVSEPDDCTPHLTTFETPSVQDPVPADRRPPLPETCPAPGSPSRVARLDASVGDYFFLHVYKGVPGPLTVEVFGERGCGEIEVITKCTTVESVAERFRITVPSPDYLSIYIRVTVSEKFAEQFSPSNFVSLAVYGEAEPKSAGSIRYKNGGTSVLPFSCDGNSFQRVLLNECESDPEVLREWVAALGIEPTEQYYGKVGNVVVFDVPPGMDPNTTGGSAREIRSKLDGSGGTAEPDFLINLFNPRDPSRIAPISERTPLATNDKVLMKFDIYGKGYFVRNLPPFTVPETEVSRDPRIAAIIDSGVDPSSPNAGIWDVMRYRGSVETEFVKPGELGYDFIDKDFGPDDQAPHGTYVAGSLMGQYTASEDLDLVHMKVFGDEGIASYFGALVSIYEATAIGSDVINMSWGISQPLPPEALTCAVETALSKDIYLFTSAGNDSLDLAGAPQWPANYAKLHPDRVVTAASYWYEGKLNSRYPKDVHLLYFTNYSDQVVPMAGYMTTPVPEFRSTDVIYPLGTSFTTPLVAGSFLNWRAWNGGGSLERFRADRYNQSGNLSPWISGANYLPAPLKGLNP